MPANLRLLTRGSWSESQRFAQILRKETVGGVLLLVCRGCGSAVGQFAVVGRVPRGFGVRDRTRVAASAVVGVGMGGGRSVGDLLLRRVRTGTQAGVRRRRSA